MAYTKFNVSKSMFFEVVIEYIDGIYQFRENHGINFFSFIHLFMYISQLFRFLNFRLWKSSLLLSVNILRDLSYSLIY